MTQKTSARAVPRVREALALRVRAVRQQRGWSQERLGEKAGLSGKFLGEVERAKKSISLDSLERLARALDVPLAELVAGLGVRHPVRSEAEQVYAMVRRLPPAKLRKVRRVVLALVA